MVCPIDDCAGMAPLRMHELKLAYGEREVNPRYQQSSRKLLTRAMHNSGINIDESCDMFGDVAS